MPFIEWEVGFDLGIEQFDEHHKHLVSLINKSYFDYITGAPAEEDAVLMSGSTLFDGYVSRQTDVFVR